MHPKGTSWGAPPVKFFGRLDLDPILLCLDGHPLGVEPQQGMGVDGNLCVEAITGHLALNSQARAIGRYRSAISPYLLRMGQQFANDQRPSANGQSLILDS